MAKKQVKDMTVEEIDAKVLETIELRKAEYKAYETIQKKLLQMSNLLQSLQEQKVKLTGQTLADALNTYLETGENLPGYKYLNDRSYKGDWAGTGFGYMGSHWIGNNQRCLGIRIPDSKFTDAQISKLAQTIDAAMPSLKTGCYDDKQGKLKLTAKGASVEMTSLKILDIMDGGCCEYSNWRLAQMDNGEWLIFDEYTTKHGNGRARIVGTLKECLEEVRTYLNADGSENSDEDDN